MQPDLPNIPESAVSPSQDQSISFTLNAPTGVWWWILSVVYLAAFAIPGHAILGILALVTFMAALQDPTPMARALWLWIVGMAASVVVLTLAPTFKPTGLSLVAWYQQAPFQMAGTLLVVLLAVLALLWHLAWYRR